MRKGLVRRGQRGRDERRGVERRREEEGVSEGSDQKSTKRKREE